MINLFDMMQKAQGGNALDAFSQQFGLTPQQSEAAVDALLPAFTLALRQQLKNPQAWPYLMAALSIPPTQQPGAIQPFSPQGMQQGQQVMAALFGSPQLGPQIAQQAATATGMSSAVMQQMMPAMAAMLTGGAWQTFGGAMASAMEAFSKAMGGKPEPKPAAFPMGVPENWGEILGELVGGPPPPKPEPAKADEPNMFDPAGLGAMMAGIMERAATPQVATPGEAPAPAADAPPAPDAADQTPPAEAPTAPDFDAFTQLVETGREVQQQHLRNLQNVMAQVWGGEKPETTPSK